VKQLATKAVRAISIGDALVITTKDYDVEALDSLIAAFRKWHEERAGAQEDADANGNAELAMRYSYEPWLFKSNVEPVTVTDKNGNTVTIDVDDIMGNGVEVSVSASVEVVGLDIGVERVV